MLPIYKDKGKYKHKYKDKVLAYIVYTPRVCLCISIFYIHWILFSILPTYLYLFFISSFWIVNILLLQFFQSIYQNVIVFSMWFASIVLIFTQHRSRATNVFGMNSAFLLQFLFPFSVLGFPNSIQTLLLHLYFQIPSGSAVATKVKGCQDIKQIFKLQFLTRGKKESRFCFPYF